MPVFTARDPTRLLRAGRARGKFSTKVTEDDRSSEPSTEVRADSEEEPKGQGGCQGLCGAQANAECQVACQASEFSQCEANLAVCVRRCAPRPKPRSSVMASSSTPLR